MAKVVSIEVQIKGIRGAVTDANSLKAAIKATNNELGQVEFGTAKYKQLQDQLGGLRSVQRQVRADTRKSQQAFEAAAQSGTGSYRALNAQLVKLRNSYKELSAVDRSSRIGQGLLRDIGRLDTRLRELDSGIGLYQRNIGNYSSAFRRFGSLLTGGLLIGGVAEATQAVRSTIDTFKEFSQALATLGAISGATGEDLQALEDDARRIGETSQFTATQVVGLQTALARLGFSSREILQATEPIADLAIATGENIQESAKVIGQSIRAYGLEASEAGRVADVLAASFNSSALQLETFAEASKFLAPVSRTLGVSIEESISAIGLLADNGLEGSVATATLRTAFQRLADDTKNYAKVAQEAGVEVFNSQGEFVGLTQFVENLQTATADLTEQEQLATLTRIVGQQAAGNFATLLNGTKTVVTETGEATLQGADALRAYTQELENSGGAAAATAAIVGDTLAQDLLKAESAIEGLQLNLVELGDQGLRSIVQGFTNLVSFISQNIEPAFQVISEALAPVVNSFRQFVDELGGGNKVITFLVGLIKDSLVITLNSLGIVLSGIIDVGTRVVAFFNEATESQSLFGRVVGFVITQIKGFIGTLLSLPAILIGVVTAANSLPDAFSGAFLKIKLLGEAFLEDIKTIFSGDTLRKLLTGNIDQISFSAGDLLRVQADDVSGFGETIADSFNEGFQSAVKNTSLGEATIERLKESTGGPATDAGAEAGENFSSGLAKGLQSAVDEAQGAASDASSAIESITAEISRLEKELQGEDDESEIRKKLSAITGLKGKLEETGQEIERIRQELEVAGTAAITIPVDLGGAKDQFQEITSLQKKGIEDVAQVEQDQALLRKKSLQDFTKDLSSFLEFTQYIYENAAQVITDITEAQTNNRLRKLEEQYEREIDLAEGNEEEQARLEEELEEKRRELEEKQFERNKRLAVISAIINGARGVVATFAANPGFTDIATLATLRAIQIGIVTATTAAQIAAISSQTYEGEQGLLIPSMDQGGTVTMHTTTKGRSHASGHIFTRFFGQPVKVENGEWVTDDEHGNAVVINKRSSRTHHDLLNSISRKRFAGKGALLSSINMSGGGIPLGEDGLSIRPNLTPFFMNNQPGPSGAASAKVTLSDDQVMIIAQAVASGAKAGTEEGTKKGATEAEKMKERRSSLNKRIR